MQQDQLSAITSAGGGALIGTNLPQEQKQKMHPEGLNMGSGFMAPSSNRSLLNRIPVPPPPPPPRTVQRDPSPSLTLNNLLRIGAATDQRRSITPPIPPPPPPRPIRISGGSSNLTRSPSPTSSCSSFSSLVMTAPCKTGPILKGELAIFKKEQAMAEALAAAQAMSGTAMTFDLSRSSSGGLDSGRSACAYAVTGKVEELDLCLDSIGDTAYRSLQPPPPPPKPQWQVSTPQPHQPLQDVNRLAKIDAFLATIPVPDEQPQLRPPSYSDWVGNNQPCEHHSSDIPKSILQGAIAQSHLCNMQSSNSNQVAPREKQTSMSGIAEQGTDISSRTSTRDMDSLSHYGIFGEASEASQDQCSSFERNSGNPSWMTALDGGCGSGRTSGSGDGESQRRSMEYYPSSSRG